MQTAYMRWSTWRLKLCFEKIMQNRLRRMRWRKDAITRQILDEQEGGDDADPLFPLFAEFFMVQVKIQGNVFEQTRTRHEGEEMQTGKRDGVYNGVINVSKLQSTTVGIPVSVGAAPQVEKWA